MDQTLFDDLVQSLEEAKAIREVKCPLPGAPESMRQMSKRCVSRSGCRKASLPG